MNLRRMCTGMLLLSVFVLMHGVLPAGFFGTGRGAMTVCAQDAEEDWDISRFLTAVEDEPDTVDFQCTTIHYTIAQNVFDRLVEMENDKKGNAVILPALAEHWEVSEDRLTYRFLLREGVTFSNGSGLTSEDVRYTFTRLLAHPSSCNRDIVDEIVGAKELEEGKTDELRGFEILSDLEFTITLEKPFEAFLACLSMPGASILDAETTQEAGERFGTDPAWTVGTGSFILRSWEPGMGMILTANPDCWQGAPRCAGLNLLFLTDPAEICLKFDRGELDILNLDDVGRTAEFYLHGDIYQDRLYKVQRISTTYIALNEDIEPLGDVRVRKALQLALNRMMLLDVGYSGHGVLVNGIIPQGMYGFNPDLPEIPFDTKEARKLLAQAGYPNGFDLTFSAGSASTLSEMALIRTAVSMWEEIGVHAAVEVLEETEFMRLRKSGSLACYSATWTADFNDPDNFFYTFFGDAENTRFRSLNYPREDIMKAVRDARTIADADRRIEEYHDLERIIVQEDAAWIPLFSRQYYYVISERLKGIQSTWNGSVKNRYREMSVE